MININLVNVPVLGGSSARSILTLEQWKRLWWQATHRKRKIRFSISALVRIQIRDQYLLVKGTRVNRFQPVGGVLKYLPCAQDELEKCGREDDNLYLPDETNKDDLRVLISGAKLSRFLKWYESGFGREQSAWREFWEELVLPGYLDRNIFPHAHLGFLRRHTDGINWSNHANCYECLMAEIFELHPNRNQEAALENLLKSPPSDLLWATAEEIRSHGIIPKKQTEATIASNAEWLLPQ